MRGICRYSLVTTPELQFDHLYILYKDQRNVGSYATNVLLVVSYHFHILTNIRRPLFRMPSFLGYLAYYITDFLIIPRLLYKTGRSLGICWIILLLVVISTSPIDNILLGRIPTHSVLPIMYTATYPS